MTQPYVPESHARADVEALKGAVVLNFGTNWCGICQAARPLIESVLAPRDDVLHLKVEDGSGRALGRSYKVKLWPTLVFLHDGQEVARVVRPTNTQEIANALALVDA